MGTPTRPSFGSDKGACEIVCNSGGAGGTMGVGGLKPGIDPYRGAYKGGKRPSKPKGKGK